MRIAIDATAIGSGRGGDHTYLSGVVAGLGRVADRHDHHYDLYLRSDTDWQPPPGPFSVQPLRPAGSARLVSSLPLAWSRSTHDVHLSYTHMPVPTTGPTALVVTDLSFVHHPESYPRSARVRLNAIVPRQARRAAAVVTLSDFCRRDLIEAYQLDADRVHVVPCAIAEPDPDPGRELDGWARSEGIVGPFVLYLGNLHPRKNVARLVEAMASLPEVRQGDLQLVVAGGHWWGGGGEDVAARAAPPGSVVRLGVISDAQREYLLRRAEVLAYPSLFEGFGLPPLEAMARDTPVVVADRAALPEVVGDAAVRVDPMCPAAIADGVQRVLGDDALRADLVAAGRSRVAEYSVARSGEAAVTALEAAAGHR